MDAYILGQYIDISLQYYYNSNIFEAFIILIE